jgi:hypothetical protein
MMRLDCLLKTPSNLSACGNSSTPFQPIDAEDRIIRPKTSNLLKPGVNPKVVSKQGSPANQNNAGLSRSDPGSKVQQQQSRPDQTRPAMGPPQSEADQ